MRRNNRRFWSRQSETSKMLYISGGVLILAILAFIITFVVYGNILRNDDELSRINSKSITDLGKMSNSQTEEASSGIGKTINEVQEETNSNTQNEEDATKIAINTSNMEKESINAENDTQNQKTNVSEESNANVSENKDVETTNKKQEEKEPSFEMPVQGEIIKGFAKDTLLYSETLKEWITHTGIDIKAEKTTVVKAAEDGTVKSIKNDPRYGITVVIEHAKDFETIYSNLYTAEFIKEGEKVSKGQTIGTVGNTAIFEIADESHLHFEILKNGENVDPSLYLK